LLILFFCIIQAERKDEGDRDQLMAQLSEAKKINEALKSKLKQSQEVDPEVLEQLKGESTVIIHDNCIFLFFYLPCIFTDNSDRRQPLD